jgi:peptide/nickel transport system substrate-binding protein
VIRRHPALLALALAAVAAAASAAAFASRPATAAPRAHATPAAATIQRGGTLVAAISGEPQGFDPQKTTAYASFQVLENVYDTLVEPGANLQMQPALATSWTQSKNHLTWTFQLRKGVKFQNGRAFTSADVVYSANRWRAKASQVAYRLAAVKSVTAKGRYAVVFHLKAPAPNLLSAIGGFKGLAVVPKEIVADNTIGRHPVGTGPFEFVKYAPGDEIVLKRNPYYWRTSQPYLDQVVYKIVPDASVKTTNLTGGQVDWIDSVPSQSLKSLRKTSGVKVASIPGNDYWYFALNEKRKQWQDVRVRQAISYGIDRAQITEAARAGEATPNQAAIPRTSTWYAPISPFHYNPAKAKALLKAAGASDLTLDLLVTSQYPESVAAGQVIAAELGQIGVKVKVDSVDFGTWLDREGKGDDDAFLLSWLGNIDPQDFYYAQHHCGGADNFQGFCSKQVDKYLDAGQKTTNQAQRKRDYAKAAQLIVKQASYIYLYNPDVVQAWRTKVHGYAPRPDSAIRFRTVWVGK